MLNIAVCDDNESTLRETESILRKDPRVAEIELYMEPEDFLADIQARRKSFDAVLLDIDLGQGNNGIDLAEELFHAAPGTQILYMTGYNDKYAQRILLTGAEPTGYLTKPLDPAVLLRYLDKICRKQGTAHLLTFTMRGKEYSVLPERILYLESRNHTVIIHTDQEDYTVYCKLDRFLPDLPSVFIRCHKSYAVNMNRIERLDTDRLILTSDISIPISKPNRTAVREAFFRHIGGKL